MSPDMILGALDAALLDVKRPGCHGVGYTLIWDREEEINWRRDCRGCHDCKPDEYTKGNYKRRKPAHTCKPAKEN